MMEVSKTTSFVIDKAAEPMRSDDQPNSFHYKEMRMKSSIVDTM